MKFEIGSRVGPAWFLEVGIVSLSKRNLKRLNFSRRRGSGKLFGWEALSVPRQGWAKKRETRDGQAGGRRKLAQGQSIAKMGGQTNGLVNGIWGA